MGMKLSESRRPMHGSGYHYIIDDQSELWAKIIPMDAIKKDYQLILQAMAKDTFHEIHVDCLMSWDDCWIEIEYAIEHYSKIFKRPSRIGRF